MKKVALYISLLCAFISCQDNVTFNNPAFEGQKDHVFWRASDFKATIVSGSLIIEGFTKDEKVTLKTNSINPGTYILGTGTLNSATYALTDTSGTITYATGLDIGEGQIIITEFDAVNNTVSGTFKFNAKNSNNTVMGGTILNFQYGVFYKVPVK